VGVVEPDCTLGYTDFLQLITDCGSDLSFMAGHAFDRQKAYQALLR
jgi:hypothetical protein